MIFGVNEAVFSRLLILNYDWVIWNRFPTNFADSLNNTTQTSSFACLQIGKYLEWQLISHRSFLDHLLSNVTLFIATSDSNVAKQKKEGSIVNSKCTLNHYVTRQICRTLQLDCKSALEQFPLAHGSMHSFAPLSSWQSQCCHSWSISKVWTCRCRNISYFGLTKINVNSR